MKPSSTARENDLKSAVEKLVFLSHYFHCLYCESELLFFQLKCYDQS